MSNLTQENGVQPTFSNTSSYSVSESRAHAEQVSDFGENIFSILGAIPRAFNKLFDIVNDADELRNVNTSRTKAPSGLDFDSNQISNAYVRSRIAGMG